MFFGLLAPAGLNPGQLAVWLVGCLVARLRGCGLVGRLHPTLLPGIPDYLAALRCWCSLFAGGYIPSITSLTGFDLVAVESCSGLVVWLI